MKIVYIKQGFATFVIPVGTVSAEFGSINSVHQTPHTGIDFACPIDTEIHAPIAGIVSRVYENQLVGKAVIVKIKSGQQYILGHLSKTSVHVGDSVRKGDLLGYSGNTGNSTAPHLHFGMIDNLGNFINPSSVIPDATQFSIFGGNRFADAFHQIKDHLLEDEDLLDGTIQMIHLAATFV